jgi:serine/threonine-protein kinase
MSSWVVPGFAEERQLGTGATGRVVAAVHVATGTQVAIKYLSSRLLAAPGFLEAFRSEASLLRTLDVPQVVRLFDYVEAPGQGASIIMELVAGVSLHEMISRQGPTGPEPALVVLKGSLLGLAAAHSLGIVHRDYKPENVLVDGQGASKLTDFGVAARTGDSGSGGTPLYMAPEQWSGLPSTPATDIYAATAVFFECLTGRTPFSGGLGQLARQHEAAAVPVELVDERLRELIVRGMAKDPAARPASAMELLAELEAMAASAYGADWESTGRSRLAARAAALLPLLYETVATATVTAGAGAGAAAATTWLGTVTSAIAAHAFLYTGIIAAVVGITGGTLAGISVTTSHPAGSTTASTATPASRLSAGTGAQGAPPSASGKATATPGTIPGSTPAPSATPSPHGSPSTTGSTSLASFQGLWYVHDGSLCVGQALQRPTGNALPPCQGNGSTGWQREWYGCSPFPPATIPVCNEWDEITFTAGPDGTITGTVTKVLDTTTDSSVITGAAPATGYLQPGDTFQLTHADTGLLKTTYLSTHLSQANLQYANPYWCGPGISTANQPKCGA